MSQLFYLSAEQLERIKPFFPLITPCIPPKKNRKKPISYDKNLYKQRHKIEIMFGRIKDWRRIAMRYDRCAHTLTAARIRSLRPYASPLPSYSLSINEAWA